MIRGIGHLRSFWTAEEVPRGTGLLVVLAYALALSALGVGAWQRGRAVVQAQARESREASTVLLADLLDATREDAGPAQQTLLNRFARKTSCRELRVCRKDGTVVAGLSAGEVGQVRPERPGGAWRFPEQVELRAWPGDAGGEGSLVVRAPLPARPGDERLGLEVVYPDVGPGPLAFWLAPWSLGAVLVCTGALLVLYRRLRRHFHSYARIAEGLTTAADDLETQLHELRLGETHDELADSWNKLIDLTVTLREEVARSAASSELMAVLNRSNTGDLAEAMSTAPLGVLLISEQGRVLYANAMVTRLAGWDRQADETAPPTLEDEGLSAEGRKLVELIRTCLADAEGYRPWDTRIEGGDGSFFQVRMVPTRSRQQTRRFVVLVQDVSQQVRADKAREEFVSQVTHELRTPLTNIRAYAETLSSGMFDDPKVISECYNVITKETRRLARLIEDMLSIAQLEVGSMQMVFDQVDLRAVLSEAVRDVRGLAESKTIDLQIALPAKLEPIVGDRDKLAVVVNNLLGNALKYTAVGGQVVLSCQLSGEEMLITVRDTGLGIDPKDHQRIFEKFQRADDPQVRAEAGTGIGLTTAREIARRHGGDITVLSRKGEGSTFTVRIPRGQRAAAGCRVAI